MDKHLKQGDRQLMGCVKKLKDTLFKPICLGFFMSFGLISCAEKDTTINVAVASNFEQTLNQIVEKYHLQNNSDLKINIIAASSGVLSNQIINNAPFDLFLSADNEKTHLLKKRLNIKNQPAIYAIGQLLLWIPKSQESSHCLDQLHSVKTLAIANPQTAPYGMLAVEIMNNANINVAKTIQTSNVSQAFLYTKDGLTEAGFIPKSLIEKNSQGCIQIFDDNQLSQSMLVINDKALPLYEFILSDKIQKMIENSGYKTH